MRAGVFCSDQKWPEFFQLQALKCVGLAKLGKNISGHDTTAHMENFHLAMFPRLCCLIKGSFWFHVVRGPEQVEEGVSSWSDGGQF